MKEKKPRKLNRTTFVKGVLRQASRKWPPANEAFQRATVERGKKKCESCGNVFHYKMVERDHKEPVIALSGPELQSSGEMDWNVYIDRLLPLTSDNYQIICITCHEIKTAHEQELRVYYRDKKRIEKSKKLKVDKKKGK